MRQIGFHGSPFIGVFACCTNDFVFIPAHVPTKITETLEQLLDVASIRTFVGEASVIGSFIAGNSHGFVVPQHILDEELKTIRELGDVNTLPGVMNAAGNLILANDSVALVHPRLPESARKIVEDTLQVDVHRGTIAGLKTVGMAGVATNRGVIVHPGAREHELDALEEIFGLPVGIGTVNYGTGLIGAGLLANDKGYVVGDTTTGAEMGRIEDVLDFV